MLKEQGRYSDYVRKYKAMEILSTSIKHWFFRCAGRGFISYSPC
jgi:hypothetical protein